MIYFIESGNKIYVIHCFQKKSKTGIKTPREEIVVIDKRLKWLKLGQHS
jgi:phage-related protein